MKACVFTLGCKQNEVESASLMADLAARGWEVTDALEAADLYLINTCAVTAEAEKKSRQAVARLRKFNPQARIAVCGCASQKDAAAFWKREGVVFVSGTMHKDKLVDVLTQGLSLPAEEERAFSELPSPKQTRTRAFLRIQDGCNRFCSYCIIPYLRGRSRSRSMASILAEADSCDAREIVLTGIDLSAWRDGDAKLGDLLLALKGPKRLRLGSLEVSAVTETFLEQAKAAGNVAPHFHLSLQSGSDSVLRAMNRHYTRGEFLLACERIYRFFPSAAITTDIIVGFPAEKEEDFALSLSILKEAGLARVHAFPYSPREGTRAYGMEDLPPAVKKERMGRMLTAAKEAEHAYLTRFLGQEAVVLFEEEGGYTENYIRVFAEGAREGEYCRVILKEIGTDGVHAEIKERL